MKIAVTGNPGDFAVWAMLDDDDFNQDPTNRGESFVIGGGETLEDAFAKAKKDLQRALDDVEVLAFDAAQPGAPCAALVAEGMVMTRSTTTRKARARR